ncbi:GspE/PulE family protein [Halopseudomonas salegens]|uniref:Type IV pilus assembly protein PilB n=1 Tax=Halopseudomonas salegens TaxID=1434072 RepID=A0A1H2FF10_9GAMM|nr:GspE/PulE family protein [Halopseudomonas salegens]SDU05950.1 type IV pilus assembly protein PilB [Halopseudomonas salegens]
MTIKSREALNLRLNNYRAELPEKLLGQILLERGLITPDQLKAALNLQRKQPVKLRLGEMLLNINAINQEQLSSVIAEQLKVPVVDLAEFDLDDGLLALLPEEIARQYQVIPLMVHAERLIVACPDPTQHELLHLLGFITGKPVEAVLADTQAIEHAINMHYGTVAADVLPEDETREPVLSLQQMKQLAEDKPTVRFVDNLLEDAISRRASDIHIRPDEKEASIQFRVDGVLLDIRKIRRAALPAIVSRIKIVGGMNIAERRLPQDGRYMVRMHDRVIDLRLSIMPTVHGESVVMRILDTNQSMKKLEDLGFSEQDAARFRRLVSLNQGILLVTGPTGSGKSTTLYAAINDIRNTGVNIITVEDPVEYQIEGIRQIQVRSGIGYTFARALRHILRHDPDVIMVGEIRDHETAMMASESALTGHLVLSTLHTNSASSTITRLLEIGIAPYLVNATLIGVLAQRLARRNCTHCLTTEKVPDHVLQALGLDSRETFKTGAGCEHCNDRGYAGRIAVYELLEVTPNLRRLIQPDAAAQDIEEQAISDGMRPLTQGALNLARQGVISLAEVYRVRLE